MDTKTSKEVAREEPGTNLASREQDRAIMPTHDRPVPLTGAQSQSPSNEFGALEDPHAELFDESLLCRFQRNFQPIAINQNSGTIY